MSNKSTPWILSLDASTTLPFVCLLYGNAIISFKTLLGRSSDHLAGLVEESLIEAGIQATDLEQIAVGVGPGSYTGVRAALSLALGLGFALDIPVKGYCALAALAPPEEGVWPVAIDARSAGVWGCIVKRGNGGFTTTDPEKIPTPQLASWAAPAGQIWSLEPEKLALKLKNGGAQAEWNRLTIRDLSKNAFLSPSPNYLDTRYPVAHIG